MKLEQSDIEFSFWRRKVDATLFKDAATQYPQWLCKVWEMNTAIIYFKVQDANVLTGRMRNISVYNDSLVHQLLLNLQVFWKLWG